MGFTLTGADISRVLLVVVEVVGVGIMEMVAH